MTCTCFIPHVCPHGSRVSHWEWCETGSGMNQHDVDRNPCHCPSWVETFQFSSTRPVLCQNTCLKVADTRFCGSCRLQQEVQPVFLLQEVWFGSWSIQCNWGQLGSLSSIRYVLSKEVGQICLSVVTIKGACLRSWTWQQCRPKVLVVLKLDVLLTNWMYAVETLFWNWIFVYQQNVCSRNFQMANIIHLKLTSRHPCFKLTAVTAPGAGDCVFCVVSAT